MIKEAGNVLSMQVVFYCLFIAFTVDTRQVKAQTVSTAVSPADKICGKWISAEKNVIVQVFRAGNEYNAKLVWFDDSDDKSKPMNTRIDYKNPDKSLRTRKLIGMDVLDNLTYNARTNSWENGMIYDAKSGHNWNSAVFIDDNGSLKVTGYWHFKFLGKTMVFNRYN